MIDTLHNRLSSFREVIKPVAEEFGLSYGDDDENDIVFCGFVSEQRKYQLMENSLALLFPSRREGWGIIVTEAVALGTPSIVYDSPGCRDAVDYGIAGYLCNHNNAEEIARLINDCVSNHNEYQEVRKATYDFAQRFSWDLNEQLLKDMINDIRGKQEENS